MAKAREDRYQRMTDLLRDLEAAYEPMRGADRRVISRVEAALGPASSTRSTPPPATYDPDNSPTICRRDRADHAAGRYSGAGCRGSGPGSHPSPSRLACRRAGGGRPADRRWVVSRWPEGALVAGARPITRRYCSVSRGAAVRVTDASRLPRPLHLRLRPRRQCLLQSIRRPFHRVQTNPRGHRDRPSLHGMPGPQPTARTPPRPWHKWTPARRRLRPPTHESWRRSSMPRRNVRRLGGAMTCGSSGTR